MRTGCPFLAQKIMYALMKFNMGDNGILETSHEHSTMQFDNFLCRSFIFSVHCCVYMNI